MSTSRGTRRDETRRIRAPRGATLSAKSWLTEAPLRLLMNNLDPENAENPAELVVYGGIGKAARNWQCYDRIVETLRRLEADETLLIQSGKPVGVFKTHPEAPRVLIANSNLVPRWASWEHFHELDRQGLMMFGQMTAGSWIYIGSQGIIQGTYETFTEAGRQHYDGRLVGRWILTAGLGGMGGAQPLAATMAGACLLAVECRPEHIERRLETGFLDRRSDDLDAALAMIEQARRSGEAISIGLHGNTAEVFPELARRGVLPDLVTDQTSAHDPLNGYLPLGWTWEQAQRLRRSDPQRVIREAKASIAVQVRAMLALHRRGVPTFDYGNNIRQIAKEAGVEEAFDFPGFVTAYLRPRFCRGIGPFRWVALSGEAEDIYRTDEKVKALLPDQPQLHRWLDRAGAAADPLSGVTGTDLLGRPRRAGASGSGVQRHGGPRRAARARGNRPRPFGQRLGGEPQPRDRSDAGWLRCRLRLADLERAAQYRQRRDLGELPSRRRRRHGFCSACRSGDRLRRHRGRRAPDRTGAHQRSGQRCHAPRRCGLCSGYRLRPRAGARSAHAGWMRRAPVARAMNWDTLWLNCRAATMVPGVSYGAINDAAIAARDGRIAWVGRRHELPRRGAAEVIDLGGRWVTPGLIDCHTHLIFGGHRASEFALRLEGARYEAIARAGGGILSTVQATRAATAAALLHSAEARARERLAEGVTVLEIKSGYGLDLETELRMLQVARELGERLPLTVRTSCLAAHALPPEYAGAPDEYIDLVVHTLLPQATESGLVDAVDGFCEGIAFSSAQTERVLRAARGQGLAVKLHAGQLSDLGGAGLAARYSALSVDHLEHVSEADVRAMASAGCVAVLLPGAFYSLGETQPPPVALLRRHHVPIAIASDLNPGTSPARSLRLMLNMACTLFRLTPEEALAGVTRTAARALGMQRDYGTLECGKYADLVSWDIDEPAELAYWLGGTPVAEGYRHGKALSNNTWLASPKAQ